MASITFFIRSEDKCPILRKTIFLSTVKIRSGRTYESIRKEPETKSSENNGCANMSSEGWDVIWHIIISLPRRSVKTKAGRLLLPEKSEKGNGMMTTSPFTNLSMLHLPLALTNLLPKRFQLQDRFVFYFFAFQGSIQPDHPSYALLQTTIAHCFLTCFLLSMFPSFKIFDKDTYVST